MAGDKAQPLFPHLQYCTRCCIPETQEGVAFDELGICRACQSSEQKIHINWVEREKQFSAILDDAKKKAGNNYDCIVPISGGKDSTFQLHVLTQLYGMKPLAVTFSHNWWSESGWYNLQNALETFNVDHMIFTPNRALINKIAKRSVT
ncbi:MAG: N-acetyl sugar amidotransferase, partial [Patescibacteria group bacterium]